MKIYTKTGDAGSTSLVGGERVSKCHPRVEAYGDADELISLIGLIRCDAPSEDGILRDIQIDLMNVSAHLADCAESSRLKPLDPDRSAFLESEIDRMTAGLEPQKAFVLPGKPRVSSLCHVARTVCRRAERHAVAIEPKTEQDALAIKYLNRLSDYLFTLSRHFCATSGEKDDYWLP